MDGAASYSSSVTCSPQATGLPESSASCMARWVMKRSGAAPCQWSSRGSKKIEEPERGLQDPLPRRAGLAEPGVVVAATTTRGR